MTPTFLIAALNQLKIFGLQIRRILFQSKYGFDHLLFQKLGVVRFT